MACDRSTYMHARPSTHVRTHAGMHARACALTDGDATAGRGGAVVGNVVGRGEGCAAVGRGEGCAAVEAWSGWSAAVGLACALGWCVWLPVKAGEMARRVSGVTAIGSTVVYVR